MKKALSLVLITILLFALAGCGGSHFTCELCEKETNGKPKEYNGIKLCSDCYKKAADASVAEQIDGTEDAGDSQQDSGKAEEAEYLFGGRVRADYPFVNGRAIVIGNDSYSGGKWGTVTYSPTVIRVIDTDGHALCCVEIENDEAEYVLEPAEDCFLIGKTAERRNWAPYSHTYKLFRMDGTLAHIFENVSTIGAPSEGMIYVSEIVKNISGDTEELVYYDTYGNEMFRFTDGTTPVGEASRIHSGIAIVKRENEYMLLKRDGAVCKLLTETDENKTIAADYLTSANPEKYALGGTLSINVKEILSDSNDEGCCCCLVDIIYNTFEKDPSSISINAPGYITPDGKVHLIPYLGYSYIDYSMSSLVNGCIIIVADPVGFATDSQQEWFIFDSKANTILNIGETELCIAAKKKNAKTYFMNDGNFMLICKNSSGDQYASIIRSDGTTVVAPRLSGLWTSLLDYKYFDDTDHLSYNGTKNPIILDVNGIYLQWGGNKEYGDIWGNTVLTLEDPDMRFSSHALTADSDYKAFIFLDKTDFFSYVGEVLKLALLDSNGNILPCTE